MNHIPQFNLKPLSVAVLTTSILVIAGCSQPVKENTSLDNKQIDNKQSTVDVGQASGAGTDDTRLEVAEAVKEEEASYALDGVAEKKVSRSKLAAPVAKFKQAPAAVMAMEQDSALYSISSSMPITLPPNDLYLIPHEGVNRENYQHIESNPIKLVREEPVSTFSIDVDTGSYSNVRRLLNGGSLPVKDAVRVEELINYFSYDYPLPDSTEQPFSVTTELAISPWNQDRYLMHVGLKGYDLAKDELPPSNLGFLLDVSGSMASPNKLGLLKPSLKMLTKNLSEKDRVAIVVYAGASGLVLDSVPGNEEQKISLALDQLQAGGSTNGASGIQLAYQVAEKYFIKGGNNRVLLATDGDFNVGTVNFEALKNMVEEKRKNGVTLTTLGFGTGNYNDHLMEQLADVGNGNYAYIDTLNEARKVLVDQLSGTINTIAKDVKIQIEFNPNQVAEYRLIGYENRLLKREDFNNDKVDAGDIGAGHSVTAIYELTLADSSSKSIDPLRYGTKTREHKIKSDELAFIKLRYKQPQGKVSRLISQPLLRSSALKDITSASENFRFAAAVAGFGQLLRGGEYLGDWDFDEAIKLANDAKGKDSFGYRGEFISLVRTADAISG